MSTQPKVVSNAPKDPYNLVYIIMYWLGIGTLLPWNFLLAVNGYWMHKFRDLNSTNPFDPDAEPPSLDGKLSDLQLKWGPYLSMAAMIPNVSVLLINAMFGHRFKIKPLLITALTLIILIFIATDVMTQVNTDAWQDGFMGFTLFTIIIFNIMVAFLQGGFCGIVGRFPSAYMGAFVQGQALGGIIAVVTNIIMLALGLDDVKAAFYDFMLASIYLASALVAYIAVTKTDFYKHYSGDHHSHHSETKTEDSEQLLEDDNDDEEDEHVETMTERKFSTLKVVHRIWIWILAVFISFFSTLAVFPSITQLAFSSHYDENTAWSHIYFVPVGCFFVFNLGDFVGRILASWIKWPGPTRNGGIAALFLAILRLAFIPLFIFCNVSPQNRSVTQVYFKSDAVYLTLMAFFSLSNGYMGNICMSFAPKMLADPRDQGQAASLLVFFLVLGLALGSAVSTFCVSLL